MYLMTYYNEYVALFTFIGLQGTDQNTHKTHPDEVQCEISEKLSLPWCAVQFSVCVGMCVSLSKHISQLH